jgi:hypothetical protein
MDHAHRKSPSAISERDLEEIEGLVSKASGDIAEVIGRGLERVEERIDAAESRIYGRLADVEDMVAQAIERGVAV